MLFRNTSPPSNPFASEASLFPLGPRNPNPKFLTPLTSDYSPSRPASSTRSRIYDKPHFNYREEPSINDIKHDNPFDRCINIQDLVRDGLQEKYDYERSRRCSPSPLKSNFVSGYPTPTPTKHLDSYTPGLGYRPGDYKPATSTKYLPGGYQDSQFSSSYYGSSSYTPSGDYASSYLPLKTEEQQPQTQLELKPPSKFKPITFNEESNHYSFEADKKASYVESISDYFPNPPQAPVLQQKTSFRDSNRDSNKDFNKQGSLKNSLNKKNSVRSNGLRFSSAEERETFGVPNRIQNQKSDSDDPFDSLKPTPNGVYQSFVQEKTSWPQFIELNNQKLLYRPLKLKAKVKPG